MIRAGLSPSRGLEGDAQQFDTTSPLSDSYVTEISFGPDGTMWLSFDRGGAASYRDGAWCLLAPGPTPLPNDRLYFAHATGEGVWFGDTAAPHLHFHAPDWRRVRYSTLHPDAVQRPSAVLLESSASWIGISGGLLHRQ